jgi:hypothetical protein
LEDAKLKDGPQKKERLKVWKQFFFAPWSVEVDSYLEKKMDSLETRLKTAAGDDHSKALNFLKSIFNES